MSDIPYDDLDPGIRETVRRLAAWGFEPTDSGDGETKRAAGNDPCETEPHVYMIVDSAKLVSESHRLHDALLDADVHAPDIRIEASYSPYECIGILALHNVNDRAWPCADNARDE